MGDRAARVAAASVRECGPNRFKVEGAGRRAVIEAEVRTLDGVRIAIGGHAGLVGRALAAAAPSKRAVCPSPWTTS
ncbi:MAG: hypothetical protein LBV78_09525, partial [Kitasatospora sp.]|nr:hypothetical protein [Kitasatospora sp.]